MSTRNFNIINLKNNSANYFIILYLKKINVISFDKIHLSFFLFEKIYIYRLFLKEKIFYFSI